MSRDSHADERRVNSLEFPSPAEDQPETSEFLRQLPSREDLLAARLRRAYLKYRARALRRAGRPVPDRYLEKRYPSLDGGRSAYGRRYSAVWPPMARLLCGSGVTPEQFLYVHFNGAQKIPEPRSLLRPAAVDRARKFVKARQREIECSWAAYTAEFEGACHAVKDMGIAGDARDIWRFVLLDEKAGLSPLFRVCVARSERMEDIVKMFMPAAREEFQLWSGFYSTAPGWAEAIPPELLVTESNDGIS